MTIDSTSSSSSPLVVNGLISGINTTAVITALLQSYQTPITDLQDQQANLNNQASDYKSLNADMQAVENAAQALSTASSWNLMTASSSDGTIATASAAAGAQPGTLSFTVGALAQGNVLLAAGGVSSAGTTVTSASSLLAAVGGAALGFSSLSASASLALGAHTIVVNQSSAAASVSGQSALPATTNITAGSNDTVDLSVNGTNYALTIAAGSYSTAGLATAIATAATAAGAPIAASVSGTGTLSLATTEQGSDASLTATGGDALATLGLATGATGTGSDAVISVDGTSTTLSSITAGEVVGLAAPSGSISATIGSSPNAAGALVAAGTANAALVSTGDGSLSDLVQNLNASGLGLTASSITESSGAVRLQVSANSTGLAGSVSLDGSSLAAGPLGSLNTITAAADASVNVGGAGGYTLTSSTNTFNNLMNGTSVSVEKLGTATVTVAPDASGEATQVATLVSAANQTLTDINTLAGYNESTKTAGPLMGSAVVENLQQQVLSIFATATGTSSLGNSTNVGITLSSTGSVNFNQQAFETAFEKNPSAVQSLFTAGGSFAANSPTNAGQVSFVFAGTNSEAGSYDVSVSQSAAQATDTGAVVAGGVVSAGETLSVNSGGAAASYLVTAGQSLDSVAAGLNASFSTNNLSLFATVVNGDQLEIKSDSYGSASTFSVSSSAPGSGTTGLGGAAAGDVVNFAGTDVAGTINGVAATGTGQVLAAPSDDPTLAGLSVLVTTPGISSTTDLGSLTYSPGLAQQLQSLANGASNASSGDLTNAIKGLTTQATGLNTQIANYQSLETSQQTLLQNEFAQMETTLGSLKNESSAISSQISSLPGL
jgi:flagellar hook-associated protein 2